MFRAMSPILPFIMVIVHQLGIPIVAQGSLSSVVLMVTVIAKPILGVTADAFPRARKIIYVFLIIIVYVSMTAICFLPPMNNQITMEGQSLQLGEISPDKFENVNQVKMLFRSQLKEECYISEAWDCIIPCDFNGNHTIVDIRHIEFYERSFIHMQNNVIKSMLVHKMKGNDKITCDSYQDLKFDCKGGIYTGEDCPSLLSNGVFWIYIYLYLTGLVAGSAASSITNAICMDSIGKNGDYGAQRAWGTVGWGIMAPISGLLIDWWSSDSYSKSYSPIIVIVLGFGLLDLVIISTKLKVPTLASEGYDWKSVGLVLKKCRVILLLFFVVMNGAFDGVISYIFILQEDMGKGTIYMKYMKLIQGLTLATQCFMEAPFMWMFSWFYRKMGSVGIMKMVFTLHAIRLFILAMIGSYGPVWAILFCELLNGPCYGLGYTAIVIQADNITPSGMSATLQSTVNICYKLFGETCTKIRSYILIIKGWTIVVIFFNIHILIVKFGSTFSTNLNFFMPIRKCIIHKHILHLYNF